MGFGTGKNMGIRTHHNFVANPEIVGYSVMARRVPCLCHGCSQKFQKTIGECYSMMIVSIGPCTLVGMIGGRSISAKRKTAMLMNTKGHNSGPSIRLEKEWQN
jgi:hypothetical protein